MISSLQYRVQRKRFNELERLKKNEILQSLKAERELSKEIVSTLRLSQSSGSYEGKLSSSKKNSSVNIRNYLIKILID